MGRYYHGDIAGKFVFQSSDVFDYYREGTEFYSWNECGCYYFDPTLKYCRECADSYKNYKLQYPDHKYTKHRDASGLHYNFDSGDLDGINERLQALEFDLGGIDNIKNIISKIDLIFDESNNFDIDYSYQIFYNFVPKNDHNLIDNWNLYFYGLQINKCVEVRGSCNFYADYY